MDENLPSSSVSGDVTVTNIKREEDSSDDQQQHFLQQVESADKLYLAPDEYELDEGEGDDGNEQSENEEDDEIICKCGCKLKRQKQQVGKDIKEGVYEAESNVVYVDDNAAEEDSEGENAQKDDTESQPPRRTISGKTSEELPVNTATNSGETSKELLPGTTISTNENETQPLTLADNDNVNNKDEQTEEDKVAFLLSSAKRKVYLCQHCQQIFYTNDAFTDHFISDHLKELNQNPPASTSQNFTQTLQSSPPLSQHENVLNEKAPKEKKKRAVLEKACTCHLCPCSRENHLKQEHPQEELITTLLTNTTLDTPPETTQPAVPDPTKPLPLDTTAKSSQSSVNLGEAHESCQGAPSQACPTTLPKLYCPFCGAFFSDRCRFQEHVSQKSCLLNEGFLAEKDAQHPYMCLKCLLGLADSKALDEHVCSSL